MNNKHVQAALMIVAVVAGIAAFQKHVMAIPVIGGYLPTAA